MNCREEFWDFFTSLKRITLIQDQNLGMYTFACMVLERGFITVGQGLSEDSGTLSQSFSTLVASRGRQASYCYPTSPVENLDRLPPKLPDSVPGILQAAS